MNSGPPSTTAGRRYAITGTVQGIGLRPSIFRLAHHLGITGSVRNVAAGVEVDAFGTPPQLALWEQQVRHLRDADELQLRQMAKLDGHPSPDHFVIDSSLDRGGRALALAPDLATCDACLADTTRVGDRRFGYVFTACAECGPRLSVAAGYPFDRVTTSFAAFPMCPDCRREYGDPNDRRLHAQTIACPACGPQLRFRSSDGSYLGLAPVNAALAALRHGDTVAVQGIGGYHLACDATDEIAVQRLRQRKQRRSQPLAVLVADIDDAARYAELNAGERQLLDSPARPIVLCKALPASRLAPAIAPGTNLLGLLLPYTPLHHQLVQGFGSPLVLTSGNLHGGPIACDAAQANATLSQVADHFLEHDRAITLRCDDSVVRWIADGPVLMRRSRGYAPRPLAVAIPFDQPVLGLGGHMKNTFCFGVGGAAYLSPHVGDLESIAAVDAWSEAVEHMGRLLGVEPAIVGHDLHPAYATTRLAERWPAARRVAVQHHHAHVVAAASAAGLPSSQAVVGIAFDGTGAGDDGTAWGGEILLADGFGYRRLATLRPLRLAGGERAIEEIWRLALAWLYDAYDGSIPPPLLALVPASAGKIAAVLQLLQRDIACVRAHGAGRYFDAVAALLCGRNRIDFDGQAAMELEAVAASGGDPPPLPYTLDTTQSVLQIDLRPTAHAVGDALLAKQPLASIAAGFHRTLATATAAALQHVTSGVGSWPVVLAGGCFQNRRFTEALVDEIGTGFTVHLPHHLPPGDGGLALGQAVVAATIIRGEQPGAARAMAFSMTNPAERR